MCNRDQVLQAIRAEVEGKLAYLDGHLTLERLAELCKTNRTYVSQALSALGGFFTYISRLRLEHFHLYRQEHPNATIAEAALASGFGTRQSFYNQLASERQL